MHTFSGDLLFQSGYFFKRPVFPLAVTIPAELFFHNILFQKIYYFTATVPFHSYAFYLHLVKESSIIFLYSKSEVVLSYNFNIAQNRIIDKVYLVF